MNAQAWWQKALKAVHVDVDNIRSLKLLLHDNYAYFNQQVTPRVLQLMAEDLIDFPSSAVEQALDSWRRNGPPEGQKPRPPMPSDLIQMMRPKADTMAKANAIAATIISCIGKFGQYNAKSAQDYMGPDAWQTVELKGGWAVLCRTTMADSITTTHAQLRDVARAVLTRAPEAAQIRRVTGKEQVRFARPELRRLSSIAEVMETVTQSP